MTSRLASTSLAASDAARCDDLNPVAARVGSWELIRLLGEGAMAAVYQARPVGASSEEAAAYAVKLLRGPWQNDARGLGLLCREAVVGRKVSHPHLVPILAASLHEPPYFLVMPLLKGITVAAQLAGGRLPPLPMALGIARQVAQALNTLHVAGWIHADVKPSNVMFSPSGHATLIDLGFAQRSEQSGSAADRPVLGTLHYIAPEMLTSALRATDRCDVYSLGVALFEMLTGQLPFDADEIAELAARHRQHTATDLRALRPQLPTRAARLVRQMLAKEPLRRPCAREVVERLVSLEIETFAEYAA